MTPNQLARVYLPETVGTPNPYWTKFRVGKGGNTIDRLANHICSRTKPFSFGNVTNVFMSVINRNHYALGSWAKGYELLTDKVVKKLRYRDGKL